jgi:hypothetical protein
MGGCLRRDGREAVLFVRPTLGQVARAERDWRGICSSDKRMCRGSQALLGSSCS